MSGCAAVGCSNRGDKGFLMKSFPRDPERRALWAYQTKRDGWQPNNNSRLCEVHFDDDQWEKTRQDGTRKLKCNAVPTLFKFPKPKPRRKGRGPKIVVPLSAEAPSHPKRQKIETEDETQSLSSIDSKIGSKPEEKMNCFAQPMLKSRFCNEIDELSSLTPETKRPKCSALNCSRAEESRSTFYKFTSGDSNLLKSWLKIRDKDLKQNSHSVICGRHSRKDCFEIGGCSLLEDIEIPSICEGDNPDEVKSAEFLEEGTRDKLGACGSCEPGDTRCRLCAGRNYGQSFIPIFGESDLAEKISRCLPIIIQPTDNLPLEICEKCLQNLDICYKMIAGSLEADSFFRSEFFKTDRPQESREPVETSSEEQNEGNSSVKEETVFSINGPIKCDLCDDFFRDMNLFDSHIEISHLLQWRCSLCDHSFETSHELLAHKTLNHSGQILTCENCVNSDSVEKIDGKVCEELEVDSCLDRLLDDGTEAKEIGTKLPDLNCTKCKIAFEDAKQFRKHHTMHLPRRIKCSVCLKRCPSVFDYLTHVRSAHGQMKRKNLSRGKTVHSCKYCRKVFLARQQLVIHLREHKKEMLDDPSVTVYKCVTCPKMFVDRALYQKHRNVHDPACWHKFRCYICNRSFMDKFKLKIHQSIHDGVKPYQCDVCGRMFNRNANMIRHRAKHFEQTCRHCEKTLINTQSLREHLKDIHGDTLNPKSNTKAGKADRKLTNISSGDNFVCGYCGKQLTSYYSLLDHERIHTGDKPYVCQNCGKAFRSITARWDHMVRHEKGNYVCELCGKIMSNKLNLRRHLRKHAAIEEKRFECKECGKLFHVRWRLNAHLVRIHHSPPSN